eukprot:Plantae.Rhodophyta-Hildenbrandia_rubra.ctg14512.p1 GENE.Plantae.Rhodophyta-Hildenbrandia_rubra.ctg14512~~Plantae.Rhodophyta-Hildenbrandia_rubra.ctg14512.p1  ORF type:complete len:263 (-),score=47.10 Plantae.Rhodophyta-Hildenbrandia_rubra.ctg14512:1103-1891(-)
MLRRPLTRFRQFSTTTTSTSKRPDGSQIFNNKINRATRYVYLRTLPLKSEPDLAVDTEQIAKDIEYQAERICKKHSWRCVKEEAENEYQVGSRAQTHLHMSALALGSYRVLMGRLRGDEKKTMSLIYTGFGTAKDAENVKGLPAYWMTKTVMMLSRFGRGGALGAVERMSNNVKEDFGEVGFEVERDSGKGVRGGWWHQLKVNKCFYHGLFKEEEVPQLTKIFCAMDKAIFVPVDGKKVAFNLDKVLSDGDPSCDFMFKEKT